MPARSRTWRRSSSRFASYPCMGRSASRLSSTRSGVVSSRFSAAAITRLSSAAPVPPLALLGRQKRIPRLRYRRAKNIQAADVLRLPGNLAKLLIKLFRVPPRELRHAGNPEQLEIAQHGRSNRHQVSEFSFFDGHENSP